MPTIHAPLELSAVSKLEKRTKRGATKQQFSGFI
jgi:hypothetical protein